MSRVTGSPQLTGPGAEWKTTNFPDTGFTEYSEYNLNCCHVLTRSVPLRGRSKMPYKKLFSLSGEEEDGLAGSTSSGLQMKRHSTPATLMWMDQHYHLAEVSGIILRETLHTRLTHGDGPALTSIKSFLYPLNHRIINDRI